MWGDDNLAKEQRIVVLDVPSLCRNENGVSTLRIAAIVEALHPFIH